MMKSFAVLSAAALLAVPALGAERSWTPENFDDIQLSGPYDVVVRTGSAPSVRAEGPDDELERLEVRVRGDRLVIGREGRGWRDMFSDSDEVRLLVTVPQLSGAHVSGSGDMTINEMEGNHVALSISGSGDLKVAAIRADSTGARITGSGDMQLGGVCKDGSFAVTGSGDLDARDLACETLEARISGSGDVRGRATGSARAQISGSGDITVEGGARCETSVRGSGEVRCG